MKMTSLLWIACLALATFACDDNNNNASTVDLEMNFTSSFGTEPLLMYAQDYAYESGMELKFQLFQFYISDVKLLTETKSENNALDLADIELVSFENVQSNEAADQGVSINFQEVPAGTYSGIQFGLGVAPDMNATQPGDYTPGHPLDNHYWSWARGYVFTKIEGNADLDGDGTFEEKLTFHIGENDYFRTLTIEQNITVEEGAKLSFNVDLKKVLIDAQGEFLDFSKVSQDHTNDVNIASFIADNLSTAIELK
ncbi:MAG: MbnP family protein [Bacteroidota bacterium]